MSEELLKIPKDIEIKFHRLAYPLLNLFNLPLNGLYNPIDNIESECYSLYNKFKNFDISSQNCANIDNLFSINIKDGKIFTDEDLDAILILVNKSQHEIIVKDLKITIKMEDKKVNYPEKRLDINFPNNFASIKPKKAYTVHIKTHLNNESKYKINIYFNSRSFAYDNLYYKLKQRNAVKEKSEYYSIVNGSVEFFIHKTFNFEVYNPFKIKEIFHNCKGYKSIIEIRIFNCTSYPLTILKLILYPKNNKNEIIPLVKSLEEIKGDKYTQNMSDSKYLTIQSKEEIIVLFKIENNDLFFDENKFILNISWLNYFDFNAKIFTYEFNNNINLYNEYYKISITTKPNGDIILNQNFKIIINLKSKKLDQNYVANITVETITDNNNNSNNGEIEIIEMSEKKIELNSKNSSKNFVLICKSNNLGNVHLPKLKLILYEEDKNTPIENIYENLLSFNCISKA